MTKTLVACLVSLVSVVFLQPASADVRQSCQADIQRLCTGSQMGPAFRCLRQNQSQLSEPCLSAIHIQMRGMQACRADAKRICGDTQDRHAAFQCLQQHQPDLSPDCAGLLASRHQSAQPSGGN